MLVEANKSLRRKLEEFSLQVPLRLAWENGGQNIAYNRLPAQSQGFFQPLEANSSLQIGYNPVVSDEMNGVAGHNQNVSGFFPGWML
ncbi:hypothetical protein PTKIN_Ptkin05aG0181500 [Pterospermum kingtungense]